MVRGNGMARARAAVVALAVVMLGGVAASACTAAQAIPDSGSPSTRELNGTRLDDVRLWTLVDCVIAIRHEVVEGDVYGAHGVDYAPGPVAGLQPC
jgi:hypothetical protein